MSAPLGPIGSQPTNRNFLSELNYRMIFGRFPNITFYLQKFTIPSIALGTVEVPNPFSSLPLAGDHIDWGQLFFDFILDEDMKDYEELFNWIMDLGLPDNFKLANNVYSSTAIVNQVGPSGTATLMVLNSALQPNINFNFVDIYPISLSSVIFDTTKDETEYLKCTASFNYRRFYFKRVSQ
jgi:hypothetical protein